MTNSCVYIIIIFWLACGVQQDLQHIKDTDPRSSIAYCVPKLVCRVVKKKKNTLERYLEFDLNTKAMKFNFLHKITELYRSDINITLLNHKFVTKHRQL